MLRRAACMLVVLVALVVPAGASAAGVNVFIGAAAIPGTTTDQTITAFPGLGSGDVPSPVVAGGAGVGAVAADATGDTLAPVLTATSNVTSPAADATGDSPAPSVSGGGAAGTANLWVDSNGGSCGRVAGGGGAYTDSTACSSFSTALSAATAGDTIGVTGTLNSGQSISGTKAVTFRLDSAARVRSLTITATPASQLRVTGGTLTGCNLCSTDSNAGGTFAAPDAALVAVSASNIRVDSMTLYNNIYFEATNNFTLDHVEVAPDPSLTSADCLNAGQNFCGPPYYTSWVNGDMMDVYSQCDAKPANTNLTIADSVFHGLRAIDTTKDPDTWTGQTVQHDDVIQFSQICDNKPAINAQLLRNRFYDNGCINLRTNQHEDLTLERNVFNAQVFDSLSSCGAYTADVGYSDVQAYYNYFETQIQQTPNVTGQTQLWIGNAGQGFSAGCTGGGASGATRHHNVWSGMTCSGDTKVTSLNVNSVGVPQAGSPLINAGDSSTLRFPDFAGVGSATGVPDAGAYEVG